MAEFQLATPVAFIIFNRPEKTARVFAEIARAKPPTLLVVADGARTDRPGEAERVSAVRAIVERVDWDCKVLTNFSDVNLGCKRRVSSGIDWIFAQVEEAIILEDDCLPDPTFFRFCEELLIRYRHDQRIGMISGNNQLLGRRRNDDSYYFSKYMHIWGWATWRDRWIPGYDVSLAKWPAIRDGGWLADMVGNSSEVGVWHSIFDRVFRGKIDTWDYQWVFANWMAGRVSIIPAVNLISNLGFDRDATHTKHANELSNLPLSQISFPLVHPHGMIKNARADRFTHDRFLSPLSTRALWRIAGWLRKAINGV